MSVNLSITTKAFAIIVIAIFSGAVVEWQFDKDFTTLSRDGNVIANSKFVVLAERTYINKNWYREKFMCPKIIKAGGHETNTRCYYAPNTFELMSRSLLNTKITEENNVVTKAVPFYAYGTRGAYAGYVTETMVFSETEDIKEFPKSYVVDWTPKDTRNYKLVWRLEKLDTSDFKESQCSYTFGHVKIDLKDECDKLDYVSIEKGKATFYFKPMRANQILDIDFVDPEVVEPSVTQVSGLQIESTPDTKGTITQTEEPFHLSIDRSTVQHGWITKADNSTVYAIYGKGLFWTDNATIPAGNKYFGISFGEKAKTGWIKHKKDTSSVWTTIPSSEFSHLNTYTFDNNKTYEHVYYTTFASIPANHTRDFKIYVELEEKPKKNNFIIYFGTGSTVIEVDIGTDLKVIQTGLDNQTSYVASIDASEGKAFFGQTDSTYDLTSDLELWISNDNNNTWDYSGNNNHGTATPATLNQDKWVTGQVGNALDFDGTNDYVELSVISINNESYSIFGWIKPSEISIMNLIGRPAGTSDFVEITATGYVRCLFDYSVNDFSITDTTTQLQVNQLYHIGCVMNGTHGNVYVNSVEVASDSSVSGTLVNQGESWRISKVVSGREIHGIADDVMIYNRTLNQSEINDSYAQGLAGSETNVSSDGLVLWTKLDESGSSDYAADSSGEGNTGTLKGYPPEIVTGNLSYGMDFDGVEDYVDLGNDASINLTTKITIAGWIMQKKTGTMALYAKEHWNNGYDFVIGAGNRLDFRSNDMTVTDHYGTTVISTDVWCHVAVTYDNSLAVDNLVIYYNGVEENTWNDTAALESVVEVATLGAVNEGTSEYFNGTIDDVRIWSRALSADEIEALYNITVSKYETDILTLSASAVTYDVISNENTSVVIEVPEVEYKLSFTPTYVSINYSTITFNTTNSDWFGQETVTVSENYLSEPNLTRIRINNSYAMGLYDIMNFNLSSYLSFSPNDIISIWYDSYTGNSDNSTLKDTTDYSQWVDTCESNENGNVLCLNFNEGYGTSAHDRANNSLNNNDGTLTNMNEGIDNGTSGWTTGGKYGGAGMFDGVDDQVVVGFNSTTTRTMSLWVYVNNISVPNEVVFMDGTTLKFQWTKQSTNDWQLYMYNGTHGVRFRGLTPTEGVWEHHVFVLEDNDTLSWYKDNSFTYKTLDYLSAGSVSGTLNFGFKSGYVGFEGTIDEVKIWNRALSASEISDEYTLNKDNFDNLLNEEGSMSAGEDLDLFVTNGTIGVFCEFTASPSDIEANTTGNLSINLTCSHPDGINITSMFMTTTIEGFSDPGLPNLWSLMVPENNKASNYSDGISISEAIVRAFGRNVGKFFESLGFFSDYYSYSARDETARRMSLSNTTTEAILTFTGNVEELFRSMVYLSAGKMYQEAKTDYTINNNNPLLIEIWNIESFRQGQYANYTSMIFRNFGYNGNPPWDLIEYYCNSSYNVSAVVKVPDSSNCGILTTITISDIDDIVWTVDNSTYHRDFYGVCCGEIAGIQVTNRSYLYYESRTTGVSNYYTARYSVGSTGTNVTFNESDTAWTSTDDGTTWTQLAGTIDIQIKSITDGDQIQLGGFAETLDGSLNNTNFTMYLDDIGDVNYPISRPTIIHYCLGQGDTCSNGEDEYLNRTYRNWMAIHIGVAIDPDACDTVNHTLYLANTDGTINYTINNSFYSSGCSDLHIDFNTSEVADGIYKMNITAVADDDSSDIQSSLSFGNFTIDNTYPDDGQIWIYPQSNLTSSLWMIDFGLVGGDVGTYDTTCGSISGSSTENVTTFKNGSYALSIMGEMGPLGYSEKLKFTLSRFPVRYYEDSYRIFFQMSSNLTENTVTQIDLNISEVATRTGLTTSDIDTDTYRLYRISYYGGIYNESGICYELPIEVGD